MRPKFNENYIIFAFICTEYFLLNVNLTFDQDFSVINHDLRVLLLFLFKLPWCFQTFGR